MCPVCRMLVYFHILTTIHGQNHIKSKTCHDFTVEILHYHANTGAWGSVVVKALRY